MQYAEIGIIEHPSYAGLSVDCEGRLKSSLACQAANV